MLALLPAPVPVFACRCKLRRRRCVRQLQRVTGGVFACLCLCLCVLVLLLLLSLGCWSVDAARQPQAVQGECREYNRSQLRLPAKPNVSIY